MNFGLLEAEIGLPVWGTPANFNGFRILAALLHGTLVVGVSQTLRRWTDGATYIRRAAIPLGIGPHSRCYSYFIDGQPSRQVCSCWRYHDVTLRFVTGGHEHTVEGRPTTSFCSRPCNNDAGAHHPPDRQNYFHSRQAPYTASVYKWLD